MSPGNKKKQQGMDTSLKMHCSIDSAIVHRPLLLHSLAKHHVHARFCIVNSGPARTCEILTRYHAPGAGWYWDPHTAAINIPIYFLTYIFSHYCKKHIKLFFKNGGQQSDSNHRPIDHEPSRLTSTPARVLCRNIAFYRA